MKGPAGSSRAVPPLLGWLALLAIGVKWLLAWSTASTLSPGLVAAGCTADAAASAAADKRPQLLYFRAPWCVACRVLEAEGLSDAVVSSQIRRSYSCRLIDWSPESGGGEGTPSGLAERFRVRAYPTLVIVSPEGQELRRLEGFPGLNELRRFVGPELREQPSR